MTQKSGSAETDGVCLTGKLKSETLTEIVASVRRAHLEHCPFHLGDFIDDPQGNQENAEESQAPAQGVGPGWVDVGFVELERFVLHHIKNEGSLANERKTQ